MSATIIKAEQGEDHSGLALSEEQRLIFMEVIEESLRLQHRSHFFNWLQRGFQCLLAHEVVIVGVRGAGQTHYDYEYLTSSRYFGDAQFDQVLQEGSGVVNQAFERWGQTGLPLFCQTDVAIQPGSQYAVSHIAPEMMLASELKRFVVHGFGNEHSRLTTLVMFGRMGAAANAQTAHLLELLMPHLHCAIVKVTANKCPSLLSSTARNGRVKPLSKREIEVLEWLQAGKTNWEIGNIMQVSPLTIKNHVQNILRKLDVENRNQAASKALKLGLITRR